MGNETSPQDNRQHALDALERRFAVAKAEVLQQQRKSKFGYKEEIGREDTVDLVNQHDDKIKESSSIPPKDDSTYDLHCIEKQPEVLYFDVIHHPYGQADDPTYAALSEFINENLLLPNKEVSNKKGTRIDKFMHELLEKGDSAQKYMQGSRSMKVDTVILLDNYVKGRGGLAGSRIRALLNHSKRSKRRMSMQQHKKCGSFDLPRDAQRFQKFIPMHEIWKGYMMELLKINGNQLAPSLLNADLHGAIIQVVECKVSSFTGSSGIMVRETAETFGIISRDDKFRVLPKKGSVFMFQVDRWKISMHGDKLIGRDLGL